jgi:hypothetical protein
MLGVVAAATAFAAWTVAPPSGATEVAGRSSFCEGAERLVAAISDVPNIDLDADAPRRRFFRRLDRIVDALERDAPRSLRKAFRTLRPVYDVIAENQENLGLLVSEPRARRALNQLARYARRNCGLDLPTF